MIVSIILAVLVIGSLVIYLMFETRDDLLLGQGSSPKSKPEKNSSAPVFDPDIVKNKWAEISAMQNNGPSGLKHALVEADKLLDYVMIGRGFSGETMGDRLKSGGSSFSNLNAIWAAHKLRNQFAHEVEHDLVTSQVKTAIENLGQGIRDLGVSL